MPKSAQPTSSLAPSPRRECFLSRAAWRSSGEAVGCASSPSRPEPSEEHYTDPHGCTEINLAAFLVSDHAGYINGEMVYMDGGELLAGASVFSLLGRKVPDAAWEMLKPKKK